MICLQILGLIRLWVKMSRYIVIGYISYEGYGLPGFTGDSLEECIEFIKDRPKYERPKVGYYTYFDYYKVMDLDLLKSIQNKAGEEDEAIVYKS